MTETLLQDIRYGLRMLAKAPGFACIAILTLALGIGANTAIFSVVYAALIRPLPYAHPSQLVAISEVRSASDITFWDSSYPDFLDWQKQSKAFRSFTGFGFDGFVFHAASGQQILQGAQVATNFFSTLGVRPMLGRDFAVGDDVPTGPKVALLTYAFWQSQFGGDPGVVGRTLQLDANSVTIIGVLPREFEFAPDGLASVFVPLHLGGGQSYMATRRNLRWFTVIGRLAPNTTQAQARAEMNAITARLDAEYPKENAKITTVLQPLGDRITGRVQSLLLILFAAVGFVLLIACANVANLLMVRAVGRRREFAIRAALGAGPGRLVAQMLTESLMLAAAGGALGYLAAQWGVALLVGAIPNAQLAGLPFLRDAHPSGVVLAFLCGVAVLTGIFFGLAPALEVSRARIGDALKEETRTSAGGFRTRLRDTLVVAEIAVSLVLLVGAGLLVKSLGALVHRDPGFDTQHLLTFSVNLPDASYPKDPDAIRFTTEFLQKLRALPGVESAGGVNIVPLTGGGNTIRFLIEGQQVAVGEESECNIREATVGYFSTMKIPLVAGRFFDQAEDSATSPKHVIVNKAFVDDYLHGENAVGKRIRFTNSPTQPFREIVGVVGNIADADLDSPMTPQIYTPFDQGADSYFNFVVRSAGNPSAMLGSVRGALAGIDPQLFLIQPATMEELIARAPSVFLRRYPSYLIGSFAALALILSMIGLYGLVSYSVSQRTREIGIRMALGAQQRDVMRLVLGQGTRLAIIGVAVGIAAGLGLTQLMSSLLYGVSAADPLTFGIVSILLLAVAFAASVIPARRAMRVDPIVALRYE